MRAAFGVKMRKSQREHFSTAVPQQADVVLNAANGSFVPHPDSCAATKSGSFNADDPAIALNRYAVEHRGEEPLVSEPAVIDLLPSTVSTDGCKSGIQLGYKLRALTF